MSEDPRLATIEQLSRQLRRWESRRAAGVSAPGVSSPEEHAAEDISQGDENNLRGVAWRASAWRGGEVVSTGIPALDQLLPGGGLARGTIVEWLVPGLGSGVVGLMLAISAQQMRPAKTLMVIDPRRQFYPPAVVCWGIDLQRMCVVHPRSTQDTWWSLEQSLRCAGVAVSVCQLEELDDRVFRRLQLAVEHGGGLGLVWRSTRFRNQPSWADVRLLVEPVGGRSQESGVRSQERAELRDRGALGNALAGSGLQSPVSNLSSPDSFFPERVLRITLLRCRGSGNHKTILIGINDETGLVRLVSELAPTTPLPRAARA